MTGIDRTWYLFPLCLQVPSFSLWYPWQSSECCFHIFIHGYSWDSFSSSNTSSKSDQTHWEYLYLQTRRQGQSLCIRKEGKRRKEKPSKPHSVNANSLIRISLSSVDPAVPISSLCHFFECRPKNSELKMEIEYWSTGQEGSRHFSIW